MTAAVKICGITNIEDAVLCYNMGADMIGMIFAESPRRISISTASQIASRLAGKITIVGVFSDPEDRSIEEVRENVELDMLQIYFPENENGDLEYPIPVLRSYWIKEDSDLSVIDKSGALLDFKKAPKLLKSCGLSGVKFNDAFLAGGLDSENVKNIIKTFQPHGVDVARGVERIPGIKDKIKLEKFIRKVKSCAYRTD